MGVGTLEKSSTLGQFTRVKIVEMFRKPQNDLLLVLGPNEYS